MDTKGLTVWVANDKNGDLFWYTNKPHKFPPILDRWWDDWKPPNSSEPITLPRYPLTPDHPWGKDLKWEDEPREVFLVDGKEAAVLRKMAEFLAWWHERIGRGTKEHFLKQARQQAEESLANR